MMTENTFLSKNIKSLRVAYGESQFDLALAVGLNSPNAISNYEAGTRTPTPETLKKIAEHYRITEYELIYSNLSSLQFPAIASQNFAKYFELCIQIFPICCTDSAMGDPFFKKGYTAHLRCLKACETILETGYPFDKNKLDSEITICFEAYIQSEVPEAKANILWWYFLILVTNSKKNSWMIDAYTAIIESKNICWIDILKHHYLKDCSYVKKIDFVEDTEELKFLGVIGEVVLVLLEELNEYPGWSHFVNYYIALSYIFCDISNGFTDEMNNAIGLELLSTYAQIGNPYATNFFTIQEQIQKIPQNSKNLTKRERQTDSD